MQPSIPQLQSEIQECKSLLHILTEKLNQLEKSLAALPPADEDQGETRPRYKNGDVNKGAAFFISQLLKENKENYALQPGSKPAHDHESIQMPAGLQHHYLTVPE